MIRNIRERVSVLCVAAALVLLPAAGRGSSELPPDGQGEVKIEITAPSTDELLIAPGRHLKVSGSLTGDVPDDARIRVALLDASGNEVRYAAADRKGTERIIPFICGGNITVFAPGTDFSEVAYTAPEMAVADAEDPQASAHDATVKCVYTDQTFYALIVSATDPAHGLAEEDGYGLVDHEGRPYNALPEGKYRIQVDLTSADGRALGSASEKIGIGYKDGTVIHEVTTETAIEKGGLELLTAWADDKNLKILEDLLPGMFGPYYQMTTLQMSIACETAEYLPGTIHMLVYGNTATSASNGLEVARYLQLEHNVENPDIARYYAFSLGEPSFSGKRAEIVEFGEQESMRICRIDHVRNGARDGIFLTNESQVLGSDTDPSDGWTAGNGAFAVAGVMKPYQLRDDELSADGDIYSFFRFLNGAETLVYTFTPSDGSNAFTVRKTVGVSRIDKPGEKAEPACYEFYSVFPAGMLKAGTAYDVTIQAYDRKNASIEGMACRFTLAD